jgi:hypothetical protein
MGRSGRPSGAARRPGGGWLGWVVAVDDIVEAETRLGRYSVQGNRHRPDGVELRWRQLGVMGLQADPQLPFFVQWQSPLDQHPSAGGSDAVRLGTLEIAGDPARVGDWLGSPVDDPVEGPLDDVQVEWVAPDGAPGVVAVQFRTRRGVVRV